MAVGFGISTPDDAAAVGAFADGVVVGSALVKRIAGLADSAQLREEVRGFVASLKSPLRVDGA